MHLDGPLRGLRPAAPPLYARREAASTAAAALLAAAAASPAAAGLADRLAARDPLQLKKPIFNVRPGETVYPAWLAGSWRVSSSFRGFQFPDAGIKKEDVMAEPTIPGFQKCSIAAIPEKVSLLRRMLIASFSSNFMPPLRNEELQSHPARSVLARSLTF